MAWIWLESEAALPPTPPEWGQSLLWMQHQPAWRWQTELFPSFRFLSDHTPDVKVLNEMKCLRAMCGLWTTNTHPLNKLWQLNQVLCAGIILLFVALLLLLNIITGCCLILKDQAGMTQTFQASLAAWPWSNALQLHRGKQNKADIHIGKSHTTSLSLSLSTPQLTLQKKKKEKDWSECIVMQTSSWWQFTEVSFHTLVFVCHLGSSNVMCFYQSECMKRHLSTAQR